MEPKFKGSEDYIQAVTSFIFVEDQPEKCDVIFVPGSSHLAHIEKAAAMYREGYAPLVLPSGKYGLGREGFSGDGAFMTEWAWMRSVLMARGVPDSAILREERATYTLENAMYSREVTDALGMEVKRGMLCCRSFHARRALLYYQAAYPNTIWYVCPGEERGLSRSDWYKTAAGRTRILSEVRKLGDQVNSTFERMISAEG